MDQWRRMSSTVTGKFHVLLSDDWGIYMEIWKEEGLKRSYSTATVCSQK